MTDPETLRTAAVFAAVVVIGKLAAAVLAGRRWNFDAAQVGTVFSLSVAQAAATLAAATTGLEIGLIDTATLNAIVIVIVVSVLIASFAAARYAARIAPGEEEVGLGATVLVPRGSAGDSAPLIALAARVADGDGGVVVPLHVALAGDPAAMAAARGRVAALDEEAAAAGVDASSILRVADTLEEGIASAVTEQAASLIVLEHRPRGRISRLLSGRRGDPTDAASVPVALVAGPGGRSARVLLALEADDLGPSGPRGAAAAALAFAQAACGDQVPMLIAVPPAAADGETRAALGLAESGAQVEPLSGGRRAWLAGTVRNGDLVVLARRAGRSAFGATEEALLAIGGVTVAAVVTPHGAGVNSVGEDLGSLAVVGRAEAVEQTA